MQFILQTRIGFYSICSSLEDCFRTFSVLFVARRDSQCLWVKANSKATLRNCCSSVMAATTSSMVFPRLDLDILTTRRTPLRSTDEWHCWATRWEQAMPSWTSFQRLWEFLPCTWRPTRLMTRKWQVCTFFWKSLSINNMYGICDIHCQFLFYKH